MRLVRVWKNGDHALERYLKNKKKARILCPICNNKMKRHLIKKDIYDSKNISK